MSSLRKNINVSFILFTLARRSRRVTLPIDERADFLKLRLLVELQEGFRVGDVEYVHFGQSEHAWLLPVVEGQRAVPQSQLLRQVESSTHIITCRAIRGLSLSLSLSLALSSSRTCARCVRGQTNATSLRKAIVNRREERRSWRKMRRRFRLTIRPMLRIAHVAKEREHASSRPEYTAVYTCELHTDTAARHNDHNLAGN